MSPPPASSIPGVPAIVFFDGECGFCAKSIRFIAKRDREGAFHFAPLQGETGAQLLPQELRKPDAQGTLVLWMRDEEGSGVLYLRSDAALRIGRNLAQPWSGFAALARCIPRFLRDAAYRAVAKNRHRLSGPAACDLPLPEVQARLLS